MDICLILSSHFFALPQIFGVLFYYWMLLPLVDNQNINLHYIHLMAINLIAMVIMALILNRIAFGKTAKWDAGTVFGTNR